MRFTSSPKKRSKRTVRNTFFDKKPEQDTLMELLFRDFELSKGQSATLRVEKAKAFFGELEKYLDSVSKKTEFNKKQIKALFCLRYIQENLSNPEDRFFIVKGKFITTIDQKPLLEDKSNLNNHTGKVTRIKSIEERAEEIVKQYYKHYCTCIDSKQTLIEVLAVLFNLYINHFNIDEIHPTLCTSKFPKLTFELLPHWTNDGQIDIDHWDLVSTELMHANLLTEFESSLKNIGITIKTQKNRNQEGYVYLIIEDALNHDFLGPKIKFNKDHYVQLQEKYQNSLKVIHPSGPSIHNSSDHLLKPLTKGSLSDPFFNDIPLDYISDLSWKYLTDGTSMIKSVLRAKFENEIIAYKQQAETLLKAWGTLISSLAQTLLTEKEYTFYKSQPYILDALPIISAKKVGYYTRHALSIESALKIFPTKKFPIEIFSMESLSKSSTFTKKDFMIITGRQNAKSQPNTIMLHEWKKDFKNWGDNAFIYHPSLRTACTAKEYLLNLNPIVKKFREETKFTSKDTQIVRLSFYDDSNAEYLTQLLEKLTKGIDRLFLSPNSENHKQIKELFNQQKTFNKSFNQFKEKLKSITEDSKTMSSDQKDSLSAEVHASVKLGLLASPPKTQKPEEPTNEPIKPKAPDYL